MTISKDWLNLQNRINKLRIIRIHQPLITIGITAFNAKETLSSALDCALAQSWQNKEIIIVDDCSTDDTAQIIETYTLKYPSIRSFHQKQNQGVAAARNIILKNASGDFIAFFDDDDVSRPDRLEKQFVRLSNFKTSDFALCHTARKQIYPNGAQHIETTPGCNATITPPQGLPMFEKILLGKPVTQGFGSMATCSLMMPRRVFEKIGLYDEAFRRCEDTDFTLRVALAGGYFLGVEELLVQQTMTNSSEKTLLDEKKYHSAIYKKYEDKLGKCKSDFGLRWLDLRYAFLHEEILDFSRQLISLFIKHPVLSLKKLLWALPNIGFNLHFKNFHRDSHG